MSWILLATAGQFINAIVAMLDKYIVSDDKVLPRPFVYAFYSCLITGAWILIFFIGFIPGLSELGAPSYANVTFPPLDVVAMSFLAAYTFFIALVSLYDALKRSDAANVIPVIGAVSALSTFGLSYLFLDAVLSANFVWGIALLIVGTTLVAQTLPKSDVILQVTHSGLFFGLHYITMKGLFDIAGFDTGFFWSRVAFVLFALSLLLVPAYLDKIRTQTGETSARAGGLVLVAKVLAGVAAFLLLKATDMGDVAVVQALEGLKFVFILALTYLFARSLPESATEKELRPQDIIRRSLYVIIIAMGFFLLFT